MPFVLLVVSFTRPDRRQPFYDFALAKDCADAATMSSNCTAQVLSDKGVVLYEVNTCLRKIAA